MEIKEGKLAEQNPPIGKEHGNSHQKHQKDRKPGGKKPEKTKDQGRTEKDGQEKRDRSNNSHNRQRRLGPKGGPHREGTEIRPSHEGG